MQTSEFLGQIILGRWSTKFENLNDSPCVWEKEGERGREGGGGEREREGGGGLCEIAVTAWLISATNEEHTVYIQILTTAALSHQVRSLPFCYGTCSFVCKGCNAFMWLHSYVNISTVSEEQMRRYWLAGYMNMNKNYCTQLERGLERRLALWNKVKGQRILGFDAHGACDHIKYARLPISPHQSKVSLYLRYCVQGEHWASPDRKWVNHNILPYIP